MVRKYSAMGRIGFMHIRNVKIMDDGSFEERAHLSGCGSLDVYKRQPLQCRSSWRWVWA